MFLTPLPAPTDAGKPAPLIGAGIGCHDLLEIFRQAKGGLSIARAAIPGQPAVDLCLVRCTRVQGSHNNKLLLVVRSFSTFRRL